MLLGMRETAATPPLREAISGCVISNCCHCWPSYQNASRSAPFPPTHQSSMLFGMRETAAMPLLVAALPGPAIWYRCHWKPSYQ